MNNYEPVAWILLLNLGVNWKNCRMKFDQSGILSGKKISKKIERFRFILICICKMDNCETAVKFLLLNLERWVSDWIYTKN